MATDLELTGIALSTDEPPRLVGCLCVPVDHPVLVGHFPGAPLVPGVLLLDAARRCGERVLGTALAITAVLDVRFFAPLPPGVAARLAAVCTQSAGGWELAGEWLGDGGRIAAFRLQVTPQA